MYGYRGKIVHINLNNKSVEIENPSEEIYRKYLGGSALNLYLLSRELKPDVDPLSPENIIALSAGVSTGVPFSGQSRMTATAMSPLTGGIGDSQCGGFWPASLKIAGYDSLVVKGRSEKPVYIWINNETIEFRDAEHLWGLETGPCEDVLKSELGFKDIRVLQIGPAGENEVLYASLMNMCSRANGRNGMGAVFGSKNLKAIVVRGKGALPVADKDEIKRLIRWGAENLSSSGVANLSEYGTAAIVSDHQEAGGLPSFNYSSGVFKDWKNLDGQTIFEKILRGRKTGDQRKQGRETCFGCVIRCKRMVEITEGPIKVDPRYGGPEYETICTFGTYCGINSVEAVSKANEICNRYGLDTMTCGATIAWAMETYEAGLIGTKETDGLKLTYGNAEAMLILTEKIAKKEGFGKILAQGSERAADIIGCGHEFLLTCRKQELPAHMPHVKKSLALIYAVNPNGADHCSSEHDPVYEEYFSFFKERLGLLGLDKPQPARSLTPEKVNYARVTQQFYGMLDSACLCCFACGPAWQLYGPEETLLLLNAVTGWDLTIEELLQVGERRINMMRVFNERAGIDRKFDKLPAKLLSVPLEGGVSAGRLIDESEFNSALNEYYLQSGWDVETGTPKEETLLRLGLEEFLK